MRDNRPNGGVLWQQVERAAAAAIAQAIKASGVVVRLAPEEFRKVMTRVPDPLW